PSASSQVRVPRLISTRRIEPSRRAMGPSGNCRSDAISVTSAIAASCQNRGPVGGRRFRRRGPRFVPMPRLRPDEIREFLDEPGHLARIATVAPDGAPSVAPIWFLFRDDRLWFTPRLKSSWWTHVQHEPRVAITIDEAESPFRKVFTS